MLLSQQEIKDIFAKANAIITGDHFVYAKKEMGWFHGSDYVNKDAIYLYSWFVRELCSAIASHFIRHGIKVVIGPTVGGVGLSQWTAHWLSCREGCALPYEIEVLSVCADEEDVIEQKELRDNEYELRKMGYIKNLQVTGPIQIELWEHDLRLRRISFSVKTGTRRVIKRGYDKHVKGMRCLIVEDVINSGATVAKTRDAVIAVGGEVVGVGCLCNRSGGKVTAETLCVPELFSLLDVDMKMFSEDDCPICELRGPKSVRTDLGKGKEFLTRKGLV